MEKIRTFIAVDPGEHIRKQLTQLQNALRSSGTDARWVRPQAIHLTLAFLGTVAERTVSDLIEKMQENLCHETTFELIIKGIGTFGRKNRPTVLWAGIDASPALQHLYRETIRSIRNAGLQTDSKPFHPHLTLGRIKSVKGLDQLQQAIEQKRTAQFGNTEIRSVELMKSTLTSEGAQYTVLHRIALQET